MGDRSCTMTELKSLLVRGGHGFRRWDGDVAAGTDVSPAPDVIVTVALNLDPFWHPAYRDRYFATLVDDDHFPLLQYEPRFDLPRPFREAADGERRSHGAFMAGPFRWLIRRLARFPRWLLWPEEQIRAPDCFIRHEWALDEMPRLGAWLGREPAVPPAAGALILDPHDASDCRVLWEVAEQVEASFYNYYLSDPGGTEVYQLHHHHSVVISIPDERERRRLLAELSEDPELLEDCSGYTSELDDQVDDVTDPDEPGPQGRSR